MVWELALGFVLLIVGTYIGSTLALRGFFGREYHDPRATEPTVADRESPEERDD